MPARLAVAVAEVQPLVAEGEAVVAETVRRAAAHQTTRTSCRDDCRPSRRISILLPRVRIRVSPWQVAVPTADQMKTPLNYIPVDQRPRVPLRFADQGQLLVSGLLGASSGEIAQRPVVVDAPVDRGHVVMFANNPIYRGTTIGSYFLVFNTILNFDNLNAGRVNAVR